MTARVVNILMLVLLLATPAMAQPSGCPHDADGDGRVDIEDLYHLTQNPADINGDGTADADDTRCLEAYLRCVEQLDMSFRPGEPAADGNVPSLSYRASGTNQVMRVVREPSPDGLGCVSQAWTTTLLGTRAGLTGPVEMRLDRDGFLWQSLFADASAASPGTTARRGMLTCEGSGVEFVASSPAMTVASSSQTRALVLLHGQNITDAAVAKGVEDAAARSIGGGLIDTYTDIDGNVTLPTRGVLVLFELDAGDQSNPSFAFDDAVLLVDAECGDVSDDSPQNLIIEIKPVVMHGQPLLGSSSGQLFFPIAPALRPDGSLVFSAGDDPFTNSSFDYIVSKDAVDLELLVSRGTTLPDGSGRVILGLDPGIPLPNDGILALCSTNGGSALISIDTGDLGVIVADGSPLPGVSGAVVDQFGVSGIWPINLALSLAPPATPANDSAIAVSSGIGGFNIVAREGDTAPGTGLPYEKFPSGISAPVDGYSNFAADLLVFGFEREFVLYRVSPTNLLGIIAEEGQPAPGMSGANFSTLSTGFQLSNGDVVFRAGTDTGQSAVYRFENGSGLSLMLATGFAAPGLPGKEITEIKRVSATASTTTLFVELTPGIGGVISGTNSSVIYRLSPTDVAPQLVARTGDPAPDTNGLVFGSFESSIFLGRGFPPIPTRSGDIVFGSALCPSTGCGFPPGPAGMFLFDSISGATRLVAAEGQSVDVDPDPNVMVEKTIDILAFRTDGYGMSSRDRMAFWLTFTDGTTGIFVAEITAE